MATRARSSWSWSRWSRKQYIVAALLGALVAITIATTVSISLAPARVSFSIVNATTSVIQAEGNPHLSNGFYKFTLVANNTSRRTAVSYGSLSAQIWYSATGWIPAEEVDTSAALPEWQQPRNATDVAVWAEYGQYDEKSNVTNNGTTSDEQLDAEKGSDKCQVVVQAKVWFKFGLARTRPYTVRVTCSQVNFTSSVPNGPIECH